MRILALLALAAPGCNERCPASFDDEDAIAVAIDPASLTLSWDGGAIGLLDVWDLYAAGQGDTGMGDEDVAGHELQWRLECEYVAGLRRDGMREACIGSPVTYGEAPAAAEEAREPEHLEAGGRYSVFAHRFPLHEERDCYAHDEGRADFLVPEEGGRRR